MNPPARHPLVRAFLFGLLPLLLVGGCSKSDAPPGDAPSAPNGDAVAETNGSAPASTAPDSLVPEPSPVPDEGFVVTASGLRLKIVEAGTGPHPQRGDRVAVHYEGRLLDGTVFDSSRDRGTPIEFSLGRGVVIRGWDEGIARLKKGGKARLVVPPALGYGSRGAPPAIPPNATLIFDVELVDFRQEVQ